MYLRSLSLNHLRCFEKAELTLQYPGRIATSGEPPVPKLDNVNLLLGVNGTGKSTVLKGAALSLIAPVLPYAGFRPYSLVRRQWRTGGKTRPLRATIEARVLLSATEARLRTRRDQSLRVVLERRGDNDAVTTTTPDGPLWRPMSDDHSPSFLVLAYGASRWIAPPRENISARTKETHLRYQRVRGLFEDGSSLVPLAYWLPRYSNKGRRTQVIHLLDELLGDLYRFKGDDAGGEILFEKNRARIPMGALSDGYRAYIGWVSDMLYQICFWSPSGGKLRDIDGVVLVDEIDLHLHPEWQRTVIATLARTFRRIQFVFTSHSPLVTGSLEWPNIHVMRDEGPVQLREPIHGLSSDQVLHSPYFDLDSTRPPEVAAALRDLEQRAQLGQEGAAMELMRRLAVGTEAGVYPEQRRKARR